MISNSSLLLLPSCQHQGQKQCCTETRSETERNEPEFVPDFARNGTENPEFVPNFVERNGTRSEKIGTEYNTGYINSKSLMFSFMLEEGSS